LPFQTAVGRQVLLVFGELYLGVLYLALQRGDVGLHRLELDLRLVARRVDPQEIAGRDRRVQRDQYPEQNQPFDSDQLHSSGFPFISISAVALSLGRAAVSGPPSCPPGLSSPLNCVSST